MKQPTNSFCQAKVWKEELVNWAKHHGDDENIFLKESYFFQRNLSCFKDSYQSFFSRKYLTIERCACVHMCVKVRHRERTGKEEKSQ